MSARREKWEAGGLSITTWTEGHIRCFVCYKPTVSIYCQTTQEVLQFAAWPASLPTGASLRSWLASLGANVHAKRAARAHFAFNVIGVLWMLVAFTPFSDLVWKLAGMLPDSLRSASDGFRSNEIAFATAIFHSAFNFTNICLLIAFVPRIARLVEWWVRDTSPSGSSPRLQYISQGLVDLGELNIAEAEDATRRMNDLTSRMFDGFVHVLNHPQTDLSTEVSTLKQMEDDCDEMLKDITSYLIQCSSHEIGPTNAARITAMLRIVSEYEEATDRIYRLVKTVQRKYEKGRLFTEEQHRELTAICSQVRAILDLCSNALSGVSGEMLENANRIEDRIDTLRKQHNKGAIRRMQAGADVPTEMLYTETNNHLEAIGNQALNIIETSPRIDTATTGRADD